MLKPKNTTNNRYSSENAKKIATFFFKGEYEEYELRETLYQDETGAFFIERDFTGEWSDENLARMKWTRDNLIEPITEDEARNWINSYSDSKVYAHVFGDEEKEPQHKSILYFRLPGLEQCWPEKSDPYNMRTSQWPTKSGICESLIGRAMGIPFESKQIGEICQSIEIGFKREAKDVPTLKIWDKSEHPAMDKWIEYLQDIHFLVAISGEKELLTRIADAIKRPQKICIPGGMIAPLVIPVITEDYATIEEALTNLPLRDPADSRYEKNAYQEEMIQLESKHGELRWDVREALEGVEYSTRHVVIKVLPYPNMREG